MLCLKYRVCIQVCRACHCWHHVSAVIYPYFKPNNQYVPLASCTVVLCLLQTLVNFSSIGFLTYILFCIIILRFPSFIDLVQIVACWYDMIWYDMSLFVRNHILFKSLSLCRCLHTFQKSLNVIPVHLQAHITSLLATDELRVAEFFLKASHCWES